MTVHGIAGKQFTKAWIDEEGKVQIDMEDARPRLMTPRARARATLPGCFREEAQDVAEAVATAAVVADRADILAKVEHRFTHGPHRRTDPLGQRYIHYDDLADLLKP